MDAQPEAGPRAHLGREAPRGEPVPAGVQEGHREQGRRRPHDERAAPAPEAPPRHRAAGAPWRPTAADSAACAAVVTAALAVLPVAAARGPPPPAPHGTRRRRRHLPFDRRVACCSPSPAARCGRRASPPIPDQRTPLPGIPPSPPVEVPRSRASDNPDKAKPVVRRRRRGQCTAARTAAAACSMRAATAAGCDT